MALIDLIGGNNYIPVSRELCIAIGPAESILYCELVDQYRFWSRCGKLNEESMFFSTVEQIQSRVGLTKDQQLRCFRKLSELGLIKTERKGLPSKRFVKIYDNPQFLQDLFSKNPNEARNIQKAENPTTSRRETRQQVGGKPDNKLTENPTLTRTYITNLNNNNNVVEIFSKKGINVSPVLRKNPEAFSDYTEKEIMRIAETLSKKQAEGKITNPVGLLMSDVQTVTEAILAGKFYPSKKKTTTTTEEYEIYVPPNIST